MVGLPARDRRPPHPPAGGDARASRSRRRAFPCARSRWARRSAPVRDTCYALRGADVTRRTLVRGVHDSGAGVEVLWPPRRPGASATTTPSWPACATARWPPGRRRGARRTEAGFAGGRGLEGAAPWQRPPRGVRGRSSAATGARSPASRNRNGHPHPEVVEVPARRDRAAADDGTIEVATDGSRVWVRTFRPLGAARPLAAPRAGGAPFAGPCANILRLHGMAPPHEWRRRSPSR